MSGNTTNLTFNSELSQLAIDAIDRDPKSHTQGFWHKNCGSSHCWYGWCEVLSHLPIGSTTKKVSDPSDLIGLTEHSWEWSCITDPLNSITDIKRCHQELIETGKIVFDRKGYDCDGNRRNIKNR